MSGEADSAPVDLPLEGAAAPPRANGELIFAAPWEGRLFGMTMALVEAGVLAWTDFQAELVAEIGRWEASEDIKVEPYSYYDRWLVAFESVLDEKDVLPLSDLATKAKELVLRPHGHDHG